MMLINKQNKQKKLSFKQYLFSVCYVVYTFQVIEKKPAESLHILPLGVPCISLRMQISLWTRKQIREGRDTRCGLNNSVQSRKRAKTFRNTLSNLNQIVVNDAAGHPPSG